jgi:hypothetical protein
MCAAHMLCLSFRDGYDMSSFLSRSWGQAGAAMQLGLRILKAQVKAGPEQH